MKTLPDIKSGLRTLFNRRGIIPLAGVATLVMIYLAILKLNMGMPGLKAIPLVPAHKEEIPLNQIEQLAAMGFWTGSLEPMSPPPPAPPTTMKVSLTYQGFFETADGRKLAYVKVADKQVIGTRGTIVSADYAIAGIDLKTLTIRNAAQTNVLNFNTPTDIEVPIR